MEPPDDRKNFHGFRSASGLEPSDSKKSSNSNYPPSFERIQKINVYYSAAFLSGCNNKRKGKSEQENKIKMYAGQGNTPL